MNTAAQWVDRVKPEPIPKAELTVISANPLDLPAALFQEGLTRRRTNRAALMAWGVPEPLHHQARLQAAADARTAGGPPGIDHG